MIFVFRIWVFRVVMFQFLASTVWPQLAPRYKSTSRNAGAVEQQGQDHYLHSALLRVV